jgi:cytidylate kinase
VHHIRKEEATWQERFGYMQSIRLQKNVNSRKYPKAYLQSSMIITLAGHHGAGKSTLSKGLVAHYGLTSYSAGGLMRELAMERGVSLIDLGREAERDGGVIDRILDERSRALGEKEHHFILDGRLAFWCVPHSFKIFLTVPPEEAAKRIYHDESRA